jgi:hypothetical protein
MPFICWYRILSSCLLSDDINIKIYRSVILSVVSHRCEKRYSVIMGKYGKNVHNHSNLTLFHTSHVVIFMMTANFFLMCGKVKFTFSSEMIIHNNQLLLPKIVISNGPRHM